MSLAEVCRTLRKIKPHMTAGPDGIPGQARRASSVELADVFVVIFNMSQHNDAVNTTIHTTLSHLENKDSYVRMPFIDYS